MLKGAAHTLERLIDQASAAVVEVVITSTLESESRSVFHLAALSSRLKLKMAHGLGTRSVFSRESFRILSGR